LLRSPDGSVVTISFTRAQPNVRYFVETAVTLAPASFDGNVIWDSALLPPDLVPVGSVQSVQISIQGQGPNFFRISASE
jgi:hypothetical protein